MENENLLVLAQGNSLPDDFVGAKTGGVGALWTLPETSSYYVDGVLGPDELAHFLFGICLDEIKPFDFWVDLLGTVR